jgi:hypothetical protein
MKLFLYSCTIFTRVEVSTSKAIPIGGHHELSRFPRCKGDMLVGPSAFAFLDDKVRHENLLSAHGDKDDLTVLVTVFACFHQVFQFKACVVTAPVTRFRENHPIIIEERFRAVEDP